MLEHPAATDAATEPDPWPLLPWSEWRDTCDTLHMWTQIVGKIRLALSPMMNEWWQVPLYVTARGLTTSPIPYGLRTFEIEFDFVDHHLRVLTNDGQTKSLALVPRTVKEFHRELMAVLDAAGIGVRISRRPVEVSVAIPFDEDDLHGSYDAEAVSRFFRVLVQSDVALKAFRSRFTGKASPVQFFWGTFDLSLSLFSGRTAPAPPAADRITRVAYADEQIEFGFWPGGDKLEAPAYFAFAYPEPMGIDGEPVRPSSALWRPDLREFVLLYDDIRTKGDPRELLLTFFESTYEASAGLLGWNRSELERLPQLTASAP
ncbi:MAG TPA: DUF5996 family protein [Polyangiaceae bacterium]|nr:DUF5996 family protein [Polyangiaceae bacterium]